MRIAFVRPLTALLVAVSLSGCMTGWPWGHKNDDNAAAAVDQSASLIAECRRHFEADLRDKADEVDKGPTLTKVDNITTVRLDAEMHDAPYAGYTQSYSCEFEDGKLGSYGLAEVSSEGN